MKLFLLTVSGATLSFCLSIAAAAPEAAAMGISAATESIAALCPCPEWLCKILCPGCCPPTGCCPPVGCCGG